MPFLDGKRVSNEEWVAAKTGPAVDWKGAAGWQDGGDPAAEAPTVAAVEEDAPKPTRRRRSPAKKREVKDVVSDVTGLDITLNDDEEDTDVQ